MKENTGYPHIDKPWMKYYDEELANGSVSRNSDKIVEAVKNLYFSFWANKVC